MNLLSQIKTKLSRSGIANDNPQKWDIFLNDYIVQLRNMSKVKTGLTPYQQRIYKYRPDRFCKEVISLDLKYMDIFLRLNYLQTPYEFTDLENVIIPDTDRIDYLYSTYLRLSGDISRRSK